jgi:hypothetical protein
MAGLSSAPLGARERLLFDGEGRRKGAIGFF